MPRVLIALSAAKKPAKRPKREIEFGFYAQEEAFFKVFDSIRSGGTVPKTVTVDSLKQLQPLVRINVESDGGKAYFDVFEVDKAFYALAINVGGEEDNVEKLKVKSVAALDAIIMRANKAAASVEDEDDDEDDDE